MTHLPITTRSLLVGSASLLGCGLLHAQVPAPGDDPSLHGDPFIPVGSLTVTPTIVQPGVQTNLTWAIEYPKSIPDLVVLDPSGGMTTMNDKSDRITIRVAGVSHTSGGADAPVALWVRVGASGWTLVFSGSRDELDAGAAVYTQTILPGTKVDLCARASLSGGGWSDAHWTLSPSSNVAALIDGDPFPPNAFASGLLEDFMTQYTDSDGSVVTGPRDIIHLFELDSSDPSDSSFDMQDLVVVTTFGKNNNGHGNNLDGVDVSNPGEGDGGPNGELDESGHIDDEGKKIKRKL